MIGMITTTMHLQMPVHGLIEMILRQRYFGGRGSWTLIQKYVVPPQDIMVQLLMVGLELFANPYRAKVSVYDIAFTDEP
jgi:hypothetical protein